MNQENSVLALYAAFAGLLFIILIAYKVFTDIQEKRKSPRLHFPKSTKAQHQQETHEEHRLAATR